MRCSASSLYWLHDAVVKGVDQIQKDDKLKIYMTDGIVSAKVEDTYKGGLQ